MSSDEPTTEILHADLAIEELQDCPDGKGRRRFSMLAYTGAVVDRTYGKFVIDLEGIQHREKVPMLLNHDGNKIVGFADRMGCDEEGLRMSGFLTDKTAEGRLVADLSDEGFPWQASVGLSVLERENFGDDEVCEINGMTLQGPISVARKSKLLETSFLYSGADSNTFAVALAALTEQEAPVAEPTPATESPEALAAATDPRAELREFLAAFPGQEGLAAQRYAEGATLTDVQLELAARDREALAAARAEIETLRAEKAEVEEKLAALAQLEAEAGTDGVGFNAAARQDPSAALAPTTPDEAWDRSEALRAEFGNNKRAYLALVAREGFNPEEVQ